MRGRYMPAEPTSVRTISGLMRSLAREDYAALPPLFLVIGGILGLLYAFLMPPMQVPDEPVHFARVFAISTGHCVTPAEQPIPVSIDQLSTRFPAHEELYHRVRFQDFKSLMKTRWTDGGLIPFLNPNASI